MNKQIINHTHIPAIYLQLLGIGMLAAGIYAYIALSDYFDFLGQKNVNIPAYLLIGYGCLTVVIAAIGCIGACKESPCLLFTVSLPSPS